MGETASTSQVPEYRYRDANPTWANNYVWPVVLRALRAHALLPRGGQSERRAFDLGCGNGAVAGMLASLGYRVTAVDPSESGILQAQKAYPECIFETGSAYDDLAAKFGRFHLVTSLEVVEHLYDPRKFAANLFDLLMPDGYAIVSTPYHGYAKNLALAISGKLDNHFTALWDGGHIKFFSKRTLRALLEEAGFEGVEFMPAGRIPIFAKSMVAIAHRSAQ